MKRLAGIKRWWKKWRLCLYEGDGELVDIIRLLDQEAAITKQRRREGGDMKSNSPSSYAYYERNEEEELEMKDDLKKPDFTTKPPSPPPHTKKEKEKRLKLKVEEGGERQLPLWLWFRGHWWWRQLVRFEDESEEPVTRHTLQPGDRWTIISRSNRIN